MTQSASDPGGPPVSGRREDRRFLTGLGRFVADLDVSRCLHAVVVRSDHAHAEILHIDVGAALGVPGVVAVHTAADLALDGLGPMPCVAEVAADADTVVPVRHALAVDRVRHVGEPVALVIAETVAAAREGAEQVALEVRELPASSDPGAALETGACPIWPQAPDNVAFRFERGDARAVDAAFAGAAHVAELDLVNQRVSACPLETRAGFGEYDPVTGQFTLTATAQGVHGIRLQLAGPVFGLPEERFRIVAPDVGGGFGLKNFLYPEWVLLLFAARRHARPVYWQATRGEDLAAAAHGRDIQARARLALDARGRFLALEARLVANLGAHLCGGGANVSTKALPTAMGGCYVIPAMHLEVCGVFTNTVSVDAYRGAGKPEANYLIERLVDVAARRFGFDALELRTRNAFARFPHRTAFGLDIDGGRFGANVARAAALADRAGFEARRAAAAGRGRLRGLGFGCFLETARGAPSEGAEVCFLDDGTVELRLGTESNGQGHETTFPAIASAHLGLTADTFRYVQADTARTRLGHGHGGARSMHMGGSALVAACALAIEHARPVAAQLLQADPTETTFDAGRFSAGDRAVPMRAVVDWAREHDVRLDAFALVEDAPFTFPNGCHAAEVEIDPDTGAVELVRYLCVDDYGAVLDAPLTIGQVQGGVAQGIGQALGEHIVYEADSAQLVSGSLMDYALPGAGSLPALEVHLEGTPTGANPLGVKGAGQAGAIAAPQTVMNAIVDALAPLGIDHLDMPATAERVWRATGDARR